MDDDNDGFDGYVESSIDPGVWMLVGTTAFCVVSNMLLPCFVSLGRRYEKRRLSQATEEGLNMTVDEAAVDESTDLDEQEGVRPDPHEDAPTAHVHVHTLMTCNNMAPKNVGQQLQNVIDKLVTPPYPDDADGFKVGMPRKPAPSEVAGSVTSAISVASSMIYGSATMLDTGGGMRNRIAGNRRYRRAIKESQWKKEQAAEQKDQEHELAPFNNVVSYNDDAVETQSHLDGDSGRVDGASDVSYSTERTNATAPVMSSMGKYSHTRRRRMPIQKINTDDNVSVTSLSVMSQLEDNAISPMDAIDARDPGIISPNAKAGMEGDEEVDMCCGEHAWWRPSMLRAGFDRVLEIAERDREMKRIAGLAIPFSVSGIGQGVFDMIRVAFVAHFLGTEAVAAYTIVDLILGLTQQFFGGLALTEATLCSHAVGAKNHLLAGQYVQISCILYSFCMIPNIIVWMLYTDDMVRLFGFDDSVAQQAQDFARFYLFQQWIMGLAEAYNSFLEVIDYVQYVTLLTILEEAISTAIIAVLLVKDKENNMSLGDVGLIRMVTSIFIFGVGASFTIFYGWVKKYTKGMFGTFALGNSTAVKTVVKTAIPLSFGQLLQYGEWEILTIFVAHIGTAEVTAWGILGVLWDTLETLTEGFGDAGEIRVAFHLGAANPAKAKISSYKTIMLSMFAATTFTAIVWIIGENLAVWMTPDATLQHIIVELLPLVGIGNIALTAGSVSWALVGAQGRYRLATLVAFISSWCITMPLGAIFTYGAKLDLQGITGAVVIGYSVTGTALLYILIRSDWDRLSRIVMELNALDDDSSSSSSSDGDEEEEHEASCDVEGK